MKFATLLGVRSGRCKSGTGRRAPSGAARTLLMIAAKNPRPSSTSPDARSRDPINLVTAIRAMNFDDYTVVLY
jgi:hypothetical protein